MFPHFNLESRVKPARKLKWIIAFVSRETFVNGLKLKTRHFLHTWFDGQKWVNSSLVDMPCFQPCCETLFAYRSLFQTFKGGEILLNGVAHKRKNYNGVFCSFYFFQLHFSKSKTFYRNIRSYSYFTGLLLPRIGLSNGYREISRWQCY